MFWKKKKVRFFALGHSGLMALAFSQPAPAAWTYLFPISIPVMLSLRLRQFKRPPQFQGRNFEKIFCLCLLRLRQRRRRRTHLLRALHFLGHAGIPCWKEVLCSINEAERKSTMQHHRGSFWRRQIIRLHCNFFTTLHNFIISLAS